MPERPEEPGVHDHQRGQDVFHDPRKRTYFNPEGAHLPLRSAIAAATLDRARAYRMSRIREKLAEHDCVALLLYDPVNIRYAFDSSNQGVWTAHNATRYALVVADGPGIIFEFAGCEHLNIGLPAVDEIRRAKDWLYLFSGEHVQSRAGPGPTKLSISWPAQARTGGSPWTNSSRWASSRFSSVASTLSKDKN